MLRLQVKGAEYFNEETNRVFKTEDTVLELEHSLVSLSKWESITEKPFLSKEEKTDEEALLYIQCMSLRGDIHPDVFMALSAENHNEINNYIQAKMTATWFKELPNQKPSREMITAELIYYWMIAFNIPFQCETWHLAKLLTLIRVCERKNSPPKKMSRAEMLAQRRKLNQEQRSRAQSTG